MHNTLSTQQPALVSRLIPDLRAGERLVLLQRQHPAVLLRRLLGPFFLLGLWALSLLFILPFVSGLQQDPVVPQSLPSWLPTLLWFGWLGLAVLLVLWGAYIALDWSDDWVALTSRRLIIMEKTPFLRESRREAPIGRVQNVTAEYPTGMAVALDFGDLKVDTAGIGVLVFRNLPRPRRMREAIFNVQTEAGASQPAPEDLRKARARSIILGTDPAVHERPTPPNGVPSTEYRVPRGSKADPVLGTQPSVLNALFPLLPQRDAESVTWHKHWIYLLRGVFLQLLLAALLVVAWFASISLGDQGQYGSLPVILGWGAVVLVPTCLLWVLWNWADWRNDIYRLDHERMYDIERLPLGLREQTKETLITRVTDVTYVVPGPLAHLLNYGDVTLKTPGESTEFNFSGVPRPREVQQEIMDRINDYHQRGSVSTEREIEAWLRAYHEAQRHGN